MLDSNNSNIDYRQLIQKYLNDCAIQFFRLRDEEKQAKNEGKPYRNQEEYDRVKQQFQILLYLEMMTVFGKLSNNVLKKIYEVNDAGVDKHMDGLCERWTIEYNPVQTGRSQVGNNPNEKLHEEILNIYSDLIENIPEFNYDPDYPYANYVNNVVKLRLPSSMHNNFLNDQQLKYLDKLRRIVESKHGKLNQQQLVDEMFSLYKTSDEEKYQTYTKNIMKSYLQGDYGETSLSPPEDSANDQPLSLEIPDGTDYEAKFVDDIVDTEKNDRIFSEAKNRYLKTGRLKAGEEKAERESFVDTVFLIIRQEANSPNTSHYRSRLNIGALAKQYRVSTSAITQRLDRLEKILKEVCQEFSIIKVSEKHKK